MAPRLLDGRPVLVTQSGAYSLQLTDGQQDAHLFEHLASEGRTALTGNAPAQAATQLRAALQLWRGRALADVGESAELRIEAARLEEVRLGATEDRIEADLALARHETVVDELQALAPFSNVHVRQALNYAIDRDTIVRLYGGKSFATATCQVITPGLPGYRRYCPYTRHPRPDGSYTGPDLARARRLVAESGPAGQRVDVWGASDSPYVPRRVPVYVASVLRTLGYRMRLHLLPNATFTEAMRQGFQLSVDGDWLAS